MQWEDEAIILSLRAHGENGAIAECLTKAHGRHAGFIHGASSRKNRPHLQPSCKLAIIWKARTENQLGNFRFDPISSPAAQIMADRKALAAMASISALLHDFLPEAEPHPELYRLTDQLISQLGADPHWPALYAMWELALLERIGLGLDLEKCAATGTTQDLRWISPRTGRAVSANAGAPYADRLLPLPDLFKGLTGRAMAEVPDALRVTGHFLRGIAAETHGRKTTPAARERLVLLLGSMA